MTDTPRFSVLLPTHNRADVLGHAIASVLEQTETSFELLVVADGCTDGTQDVVASFDDPRLRFFDLPKAPHFGYANRNVALREARGRLVAFAAHDDLLMPDHLQQMGDLLDSSGRSWGYSRPLWVSTDGIVVPYCTNLGLADEMREFLEQRNSIPAACIVHTRDVLERSGFWPEDVASAADWVLWRRMIAADGGQAAYLRQPTTLHFSANWKQSRFSAMEEVRRMVAIADSAAWWPAMMRHPPAAEPEQATIWRSMRGGGASWIAALREATQDVIDRTAWTLICKTVPMLEVSQQAQARAEETALALGGQVASVRTEASVAQAELARIRTELAYASATAEGATADAAAVRAEAEVVRAEAAALRVAANLLRGEAGDVRARLATERSGSDVLRAELATARTEAEALRAELATARTDLATARFGAEAQRAAADAANAEASAVRAALNALHGSSSWQVTAPLRWVMRTTRRNA